MWHTVLRVTKGVGTQNISFVFIHEGNHTAIEGQDDAHDSFSHKTRLLKPFFFV